MKINKNFFKDLFVPGGCSTCKSLITSRLNLFQPPFSFWEGNFYLGEGKVICSECIEKLGFLEPDKMSSFLSRRQEMTTFGEAQLVDVLYLSPYGGYLKDLLHEFKLGKNTSLKFPLGKLLALRLLLEEEKFIHHQGRLKLLEHLFLKAFIGVFCSRECFFYDAVSYIPLHENRLFSRGFDQAKLLAEETAKTLGLPLYQLLSRSEDTLPQGRLSRRKRKINVKGKFELNPLVGEESYKGKRIILIDDIITTGTSTKEGTSVLYKAGVDIITALVLCR